MWAEQEVGERTAVLVGVGTAARPLGDESEPVSAIDLMEEAASVALDDAACSEPAVVRELRRHVGIVAVPEGDWPHTDPARQVASRIGASSARSVRADVGVPQITPLRVAAQRIAEGVVDAVLVVGGEARASRSRRVAGGVAEADGAPGTPDERWSPEGEIMAGPEIEAGLWDPVAQYACIDNALRYAQGCTVDQQLDDNARLWEAFNRVAEHNPLAAFPEQRTRGWLRDPGPGNRLLAFPYAKWHSTQWTVDQAGALLVCSAGTARRCGIAPDRWVFPHVLLESSDCVSLTRRDLLHRWPAMRVLGSAAGHHLGRRLEDVDHLEVYSCFPAAVKVQQLELGLPVERVPTITGGMTFAGGPFNNFTYQATAAMAQRLRAEPGSVGLVTTVSGLLTKPGLGIWSTTPPPTGALTADLGAEAAAATARREVTGTHHGAGVIATCTLVPGRDGAPTVFVVADLPNGGRWIGTSADPQLEADSVRSELIGRPIRIDGTTCRPA
jgi:acetyl-CoA C-acetyltransferase